MTPTIALIRGALISCGLLLLSSRPAVGAATVPASIRLRDLPGGEITREVTLFGFDNRAFPFQSQLQTHLLSGKFHSLVLRPGPVGAHDQFLRYYGTIIRRDGKFHLWYIGSQGQTSTMIGYEQASEDDKSLCYATSDDGIHWEKPNLGLVEYHGSKANNLVAIPTRSLQNAAVVLYEPDDADPARRYKLAYEVKEGSASPSFNAAFSPDGLHWTPSTLNPVGPFLEMTGAMKWKGNYYVTGQDSTTGHQPIPSRQLATFVSKDFEHWSPVAAVGLNRSPDLSGPSRESIRGDMEEVHVGAGLWNRGNVALGIYGQWHGHPTGDRRFISIDLGLALTHDGLHYFEPIPGFKLVTAREQPESPADGFPALVQGQGIENVGERTYFWFSLWKPGPGTGLRLVTWERDRLGMLQPYAAPRLPPQAISCAVQVTQGRARVFLNASGLGPNANLRVSLLDDTFRPIDGFSGADAAIVTSSHFRAPVSWKRGDVIGEALGEVHLQVEFTGVRPEDAKLHALYLVPEAAN